VLQLGRQNHCQSLLLPLLTVVVVAAPPPLLLPLLLLVVVPLQLQQLLLLLPMVDMATIPAVALPLLRRHLLLVPVVVMVARAAMVMVVGATVGATGRCLRHKLPISRLQFCLLRIQNPQMSDDQWPLFR